MRLSLRIEEYRSFKESEFFFRLSQSHKDIQLNSSSSDRYFFGIDRF